MRAIGTTGVVLIGLCAGGGLAAGQSRSPATPLTEPQRSRAVAEPSEPKTAKDSSRPSLFDVQPIAGVLWELQGQLDELDRRRLELSGEIESKQREAKELADLLRKSLPDPASIQPEPFEAPDPPPHEGAMIDWPYNIEPPDLMVVEVLEGIPGRPITGERLVRPDGTISLDFYGKVHVRGLRPDQAKTKIILHLRPFLSDEVLGLYETDPDTGKLIAVPPAESNRVFVDVTSYNHQVYYVLGEVAAPGRLPFTGNETVLDALQYSSGPLATADLANIRLHRPGSGSKPARDYKIDLEAIRRGDAKANLQLLPGDRLVVGRLAGAPSEPAAGDSGP